MDKGQPKPIPKPPKSTK